MNVLASNLLAKREEKRYTQSYVAMRSGMSQPNYSNIERGKTNPSIKQLKKFSEIFGTSIDELISDKAYLKPEDKTSIFTKKKILTDSDKDSYIRLLETRLRKVLSEKRNSN